MNIKNNTLNNLFEQFKRTKEASHTFQIWEYNNILNPYLENWLEKIQNIDQNLSSEKLRKKMIALSKKPYLEQNKVKNKRYLNSESVKWLKQVAKVLKKDNPSKTELKLAEKNALRAYQDWYSWAYNILKWLNSNKYN